MKALTLRLAKALDGHGVDEAETEASAMLSQLVGAVSLARAVRGRGVRRDLGAHAGLADRRAMTLGGAHDRASSGSAAMLAQDGQPPIGHTLELRLVDGDRRRARGICRRSGAGDLQPDGYGARRLCGDFARFGLWDRNLFQTRPEGQSMTTLELKVAYHRAMTADTGPVRAEGFVVVSMGRRVAFTEARLTDAAGRLLASATSTLLVTAACHRRRRAGTVRDCPPPPFPRAPRKAVAVWSDCHPDRADRRVVADVAADERDSPTTRIPARILHRSRARVKGQVSRCWCATISRCPRAIRSSGSTSAGL